MTLLTKILSILVLVLSLVYMGIAATLFAYRVNYKALLEKAQAQAAKQAKEDQSKIDDLTARKTQVEADLQEAQKRTSALESVTKELEKESLNALEKEADLTAQIKQKDMTVESLTALMKSLDAQAKESGNELTLYKNQVEHLQENFDKVRTDFLGVQSDLGRVKQENAEMATVLMDKTRALQDANQTLTRLKQLNITLPEVVGNVKPEAVDGVVQAVSDKVNLLIISVGQEAGAGVGDQFTVYRDSNFVGKIQVERVGRSWASARSLLEFQKDKIHVGDRVTNRIY